MEAETEASSQLLTDLSEFLGKLRFDKSFTPPDTECVATVRELSKHYSSGQFEFAPLDITIHAGEMIGVVGENGNGKTTLLRMVAGDLESSGGDICYGVDMPDEINWYAEKRQIAYIPQRIPRWYGKLKNNLHFAAASRGIYGFENEFLVTVMLTRLGLDTYKDLYWTQISSGYRTRFELARILLLDPKLLVLDEPLANLDINAQQTFLHDLRNLSKSARKPLAVLFSSQQLHEVEKVADHIIFLKNGSSVYNSTVDSQEVLTTHTEIELETKTAVQELEAILVHLPEIRITVTGSLVLIRCSREVPPDDIVEQLIRNKVRFSYFRDLSGSTKRFFYQKKGENI